MRSCTNTLQRLPLQIASQHEQRANTAQYLISRWAKNDQSCWKTGPSAQRLVLCCLLWFIPFGLVLAVMWSESVNDRWLFNVVLRIYSTCILLFIFVYTWFDFLYQLCLEKSVVGVHDNLTGYKPPYMTLPISPTMTLDVPLFAFKSWNSSLVTSSKYSRAHS